MCLAINQGEWGRRYVASGNGRNYMGFKKVYIHGTPDLGGHPVGVPSGKQPGVKL
jgi:hypothetical protein